MGIQRKSIQQSQTPKNEIKTRTKEKRKREESALLKAKCFQKFSKILLFLSCFCNGMKNGKTLKKKKKTNSSFA